MIDLLGCSIPYVYSWRSVVCMCWCNDCFLVVTILFCYICMYFFKVVVGCFSQCSDLIFDSWWWCTMLLPWCVGAFFVFFAWCLPVIVLFHYYLGGFCSLASDVCGAVRCSMVALGFYIYRNSDYGIYAETCSLTNFKNKLLRISSM
jgi:hypothetical protein